LALNINYTQQLTTTIHCCYSSYSTTDVNIFQQ